MQRTMLKPYAQCSREQLEHYEPPVVHVRTGTNEVVQVDDAVATLLS